LQAGFVNIACVQFDIAWENKPVNYANVSALLRASKLPPGTLAILPEMFATGFSMNVAAIAESPGGETEQFLAAQAKELGLWLLGGVVTRTASAGRNECVLISPAGELAGRYAKRQPFTPSGESASYEAGAQSFTFACGEISIAPFICYDLRFPEVARAVAPQRPHLMTFIASWPDKRLHHWTRLLQARAIENQCYVAGVNRIGRDPQHSYSGRSLIIDPHGEVLADAADAEAVIQARLDTAALEEYRRVFPALDDIKVS
jgi:omega-amidase